MGEEVRIAEYNGGGGDEDRVFEWEDGLPSADDLTPLTQLLIPPELASAFRITPEPYRSMGDVNRASQNTLSSLSATHNFNNNNSNNNFKSFNEEQLQPIADMETDPARDSRKIRRIEQGNCVEEAENNISSTDDGDGDGDGGGGGGGGGRTIKRPRLVWTPQLHKRFIDVVAHLGVKNAVPKTIMQLMNVEGLTRENVASHLQKYRLYLKRMQGLSNEGPSASDHLFASTPLPQQSSHESGHSQQNNSNGHMGMPMQIPMPYPPQMMGMTGHGGHGHGGYHGYNMMQQRDWSGNKFGSIAPYHHLAPNDK